MTYDDTLAIYRRLLEANPGKALDLGCDTVAVLIDGQLRAAYRHADGRVDLARAYDFNEEHWDDENECWAGDDSSLSTADSINHPTFFLLDAQDADAASTAEAHASTGTDGEAQTIEQLRASVEGGLRELMQRCKEPVTLRYHGKVALEVCPHDYGSRVSICHDELGWTCVNYTHEGLIVDVFDQEGDESIHSASFLLDDLACTEDDD